MSEVLTYKPIQVLSYDPTKTLTLRTAFVADMNRRFKALIKVIKEAIVEQDCFGLEVLTQAELTPPYSQAFNFPSVQEKVSAFMEWLKIQEERGLLETSQNWRIGTSLQEAWTNLYIEDSYKRGVQRARYEMKKNGYEVPTTEASGGIDAIMGASFHVDRVGIAYIRAFTELQGITAAMDTVISEVLAQGLIDGDGARLIARKLEALISGKGLGELGITDKRGRFIPAQQRARTLARTEIIRAHHLANIQEYKNWQVLGVQVIAEFSSAGDDRVCVECSGYHGNRYTLKEVEFMIPVHPNCFIDPQIPIYTSTGWKPIGKIEVGNLVLTHKHRFRKVTQLIRTAKQLPELIRIWFQGDVDITVTIDHPILTTNGWKSAREFKVGDYAMMLVGTNDFIEVAVKQVNQWRAYSSCTLYNFSVEEDESYIAKGVVVHNCRCIALPITKLKK